MNCVVAVALSAVLFAVSSASSPFSDFSVFGYNPVANPAAIVPNSGSNARFTVLTDYVVRMEYSHTGVFEDSATITFLNRNLPVPQFTSSVSSSGWLTVNTSRITLMYQVGQVFAAWTLKVSTAAGAAYSYGDADNGNLLGTVKSLDELCTITLNCTQNANTYVHDESLHCAWGVVSQSGWTTIDDSHNYVVSSVNNSWFSASEKNANNVDLYFLGHGANYRQALQDYVNLAGKTPMIHRAMLGAWWTRWYDFDNGDVERLVGIFEKESVPLDVLVLDMNWHTKNDWTGYTWDRQLYPYPQDTLAFLKSKGLHSAANLHDADGIGYWEDTYKQMCSVMGLNPAAQQPVQFAPLNRTYMHTLEDVTLANAGFDLYWIDWQQGGQNGGCPGDALNPTFITDHVRSTDKIRRGENGRDAILARWGGLGGHRYPVGFSGDVSQLSWECFAFQPYFSVTAANVAYGYISHDLVGPADDHELHVRWMQFGSFSGVLRIHDRGMSAGSCYPNCAYVNIWKLPYVYFDAIRDAMQRRVALLPYMYTEMRRGHDTGVTMVYPMYYDWPTEVNAYLMGPNGVYAQYMFGPSMLVAPICVQGDSNMVATKTIWLPPVTWYDDTFGELIEGGATITRSYDLSEIPIFIRAGAIIPRVPNPQTVGIGTQAFTNLDIYIYPGNSTASYDLYEDNTETLDYLTGKSTTQTYSYTRTGTAGITISIGAAVGSFTGQLTQRYIRIFLVGSMPIATASVGTTSIPASRFPQPSHFTYDGEQATAIIDVGSLSTTTVHTVTVQLGASQNDAQLARVKGFASRTKIAKRTMDNFRETPYSTTTGPGLLKQSAAHAVELSYLAMNNVTQFTQLIGSEYRNLVSAALTEIGGNPNPAPPTPAQTALVQLWSATRKDMLLCGTPACIATNSDYEIMWTEGYQPLTNTASGAIAFNDFYSNEYDDNWGDVVTTPPNGYQAAIFDNGYVFNAQQSGEEMECLQLWVNPTTNDHMTLASPGLKWAGQNGYVRTENCLAYVLKSPPTSSASMQVKVADAEAKKLRDAATSYAEELLQSVLAP
jgi:alpha-glucosidase (family GH31 glycosyl hydrolase)